MDQQIKDFNIKEQIPYTQEMMHKIAVAPMLDVTYTHQRVFMRLLTQYTTLWTEMIHTNALIHSKFGHEHLLRYNPIEKPLVLQFGGNDPDKLLQCSKFAEEMGYDEINLNVGCPSQRVQEGAFGACLMKTPQVVINAVKKMSECNIPVTVKCRLGVDEFDSYEFASEFIKKVSEETNIKHFIIHARKAHLKGLNPKENRTIPPLKWDWVVQLKKDYPHLEFSINGGFTTVEQIQEILKPENNLKGCMIGRAAMDNPWIFSDFDRLFFNKKNQGYSKREVLQIYARYCEEQLKMDPHLNYPVLTKPLVNLFFGQKNNGKYRQHLAEYKEYKLNKGFIEFIDDAIKILDVPGSKQNLDERPPQ